MLNTKKIMQGTQYKFSEKSQGVKIINIYDVETECSVNTQPCFLLSSFEGFGQLNFHNHLYFCGGSEKTKGGTYFLMYDPMKVTSNLTHLINCLYDHKYPSMSSCKNEFILVVGGMERNLKCEIYSITKRKWKALPDLPEPRYGCGLFPDEKTDQIYLFGGMCDSRYCSSLLKLNMKSLVIWESVIVKENSNLLQRSHFATMKFDGNRVLIFGGSTERSEYDDSVIQFDLQGKTAELADIKLVKPSKFLVSNFVELGNQLFYFFDSDLYIHMMNKETLTFRCSDFRESNNDNEENVETQPY